MDSNGTGLKTVALKGPSPTQRKDATNLILKKNSGSVPSNYKVVKLRIKVNGTHGLIDNVSLILNK